MYTPYLKSQGRAPVLMLGPSDSDGVRQKIDERPAAAICGKQRLVGGRLNGCQQNSAPMQ